MPAPLPLTPLFLPLLPPPFSPSTRSPPLLRQPLLRRPRPWLPQCWGLLALGRRRRRMAGACGNVRKRENKRKCGDGDDAASFSFSPQCISLSREKKTWPINAKAFSLQPLLLCVLFLSLSPRDGSAWRRALCCRRQSCSGSGDVGRASAKGTNRWSINLFDLDLCCAAAPSHLAPAPRRSAGGARRPRAPAARGLPDARPRLCGGPPRRRRPAV